jgi:multicomponent Na+:H+ antiporter subunit B
MYVLFHGEYGPGGGFQAGVIYSVAFMLYALVYGMETTERILPLHVLRILASTGILIYIGTGMAAIFMGGNFLDYSMLSPDRKAGQLAGIMIIELGVGITVSSVMLIIFYTFASRERP